MIVNTYFKFPCIIAVTESVLSQQMTLHLGQRNMTEIPMIISQDNDKNITSGASYDGVYHENGQDLKKCPRCGGHHLQSFYLKVIR